MNIVLADLMIRDEARETLLIAPKNGFHYTLDRHTGELLAVGKFAKINWATDIDLETGKPVYDPAGEYWNLPEGEKAFIWPNMWGSHGWNPMAFHPGHALSYIPVVDAPAQRSRAMAVVKPSSWSRRSTVGRMLRVSWLRWIQQMVAFAGRWIVIFRSTVDC